MTNDKERDHVCANLDQYVVKAVGESGGYAPENAGLKGRVVGDIAAERFEA